MIHYLTPYSTDKNIGGAYNDAIRRIKANMFDWIVLMDGDVAFLTPEWGRQIQDVADTTDFDLIGCMTGRLRSAHQLHEGKFDAKCDMYANFEIARDLESDYWSEVEEVPGIAGMFMMFQYRTWVKVGGFKERDIKSDMDFNRKVKNLGGKVGVIRGLYAFHGYRLWEKAQHKAMNSFNHLK